MVILIKIDVGVNKTKDFNKLCISEQGDKTAYLILEEIADKLILTAEYTNLDNPDVICPTINNKKSEFKLAAGNLICNQTSSKITVYADLPSDKKDLMYTFWNKTMLPTCEGLIS